MTPTEEIDYILNDCFLAVGQAIGTERALDFEAIAWWRARYRVAFLDAMTLKGNSWAKDRRRVTAVGRFLGQRALFHTGDSPSIDIESARRASADIESGCRMNAVREGVEGLHAQYPSVHCDDRVRIETETNKQGGPS
jgi:hypothetical protein